MGIAQAPVPLVGERPFPAGARQWTRHGATGTAAAQDGSAVTTSVASKSIVTARDLSGASPQLVIGTMEVPLTDATLVAN